MPDEDDNRPLSRNEISKLSLVPVLIDDVAKTGVE
jgi:hypothetical protein